MILAGKPNSISILPVLKKAMRKEMAARLGSMTEFQQQTQSSLVTEKLLQNEVYKNAKSVCVFLNMPGEFQTGAIVRDIFQSKKKCYVPRVESSHEMKMLQAFSLEDIASFPRSKWGIPEPPVTDAANKEGKRSDALETLDVDLMLIPGVAFDYNFRRLGHGRGYYDRFLNHLETKLAALNRKFPSLFGLAFFEQMVSQVPVESHDRVLDDVMFVEPTLEIELPGGSDGSVKGKREREAYV